MHVLGAMDGATVTRTEAPLNTLSGGRGSLFTHSSNAHRGTPTTTLNPVAQKEMNDGEQNINPDFLANETPISLDGVKCTGFIDSLSPNVHHHHFIHLATGSSHTQSQWDTKHRNHGGSKVSHLGYVETHLQVSGVKAFNKDVLRLILEDNPYSQWVPIQVGNLHLDRIIHLISKDEINALTHKGPWGRLATLLANRSAALKAKGLGHFDLNEVCGNVKTTKSCITSSIVSLVTVTPIM